MPLSFLLALQASGMVVDWLGKNEQIRLGRMGAQLEQAGINANIEQTRLQTEQESLESMRALRKNLGTQAATMAARGIRAGAGNAVLISNESIGNFNADERMRKINQMSRETQLKAGVLLSKLHQQTYENQTWNQFTNNIISKIPTSPDAYQKIGESFGLTRIGA